MIYTSKGTGLSIFVGRSGNRLNEAQLRAFTKYLVAGDESAMRRLADQAGLTRFERRQAYREVSKKMGFNRFRSS